MRVSDPRNLADRIAHWLIVAVMIWCGLVIAWGVPVCVVGLWRTLTN